MFISLFVCFCLYLCFIFTSPEEGRDLKRADCRFGVAVYFKSIEKGISKSLDAVGSKFTSRQKTLMEKKKKKEK